MEDIEDNINAELGDVKHVDIKKEEDNSIINIKALVENAKIPNSELNIK